MEKVNLAEKLALITEHWAPAVAGEVNDASIKLVKLIGEFIWHHHENEDEMFLILQGTLLMRFRDRDVTLETGEFLIIPKGVEHMPVAEKEVHVLLVEPSTTVNTGNIRNDRTREIIKI